MAEATMPELGETFQLPSLDNFCVAGVYFLHQNGEVVYVGQSTDMRRRVAEHWSDRCKAFDAVSFKPCSPGALDRLERYYIERLVPKYNRCLIAKRARATGCSVIEPKPQRIGPWLSAVEAASEIDIPLRLLSSLKRNGLIATRRLPRSSKVVYDMSSIMELRRERPDIFAAL